MSDSDIPTFEFQTEEDGSLSLKTAVFQALGASSACWDNLSTAGTFQSDRAEAIGNALLEKIHSDRNPPLVGGDIVDIHEECFTNGDVISYQGQNYYRACGYFVADRVDGGQSSCVKRIGHPGHIHEDYDGETKDERNDE